MVGEIYLTENKIQDETILRNQKSRKIAEEVK